MNSKDLKVLVCHVTLECLEIVHRFPLSVGSKNDE